MIEIRVTGLENLQDAEGELREWGERPFDGGAALRIKKQASCRLKSYIQNDQYKIRKSNTRNSYGRT